MSRPEETPADDDVKMKETVNNRKAATKRAEAKNLNVKPRDGRAEVPEKPLFRWEREMRELRKLPEMAIVEYRDLNRSSKCFFVISHQRREDEE